MCWMNFVLIIFIDRDHFIVRWIVFLFVVWSTFLFCFSLFVLVLGGARHISG